MNFTNMIVTFDSKKLEKEGQDNLLRAPATNSTDLKINRIGPGNYTDDIEDAHSGKRIKRSRNGCLTCKVRKKKCGERRPVCQDCERLHKECVWIDQDTMSEDEIRVIRKKLEEEESRQKLRKRKSKFQKENEERLSLEMSQEDSQEMRRDLSVDLTLSLNREKTQSKNKEQIVEPIPSQNESHSVINNNQADDDRARKRFKPEDGVLPPLSPLNPLPSFPLFGETLPNGNSNNNNNNNNNINNSHSKRSSIQLSPSFVSLLKEDQLLAHAPLDQEQTPHTIFYNFLKDFKNHQLQQNQQLPLDGESGKLTLVDENGQVIERDTEQTQQLVTGSRRQSEIRPSPTSFNPLSPYEMYYQFENNSYPSPNFNQFFTAASSMLLPEIPKSPGLLPQLDSSEFFLYNYYVETLSNKISIAPSSQDDSNCYQKVFLPLAHQDKGVLYSILAWACFHLGGNWKEQGNKYIDIALDHISGNRTNLKNNKHGDAFTESSFDRNSSVLKVATLLILCGAEISRGDVKKWSVYLSWCWKVLSSNGGILNFNQTREENWLISNFAYHDLLATSVSNRGTYFPSSQYDIIFEDIPGFSRGRLNPLLGVCKKLYKIIGEISSLVFESKKILHEYYVRENEFEEITANNTSTSPDPIEDYVLETDSQTSFHTKRSRLLYSIIERATNLEHEIDSAKPNADDLVDLTDDELELQLTVFETFQLVAKLFIRQAVMKINPSSLESQVLANDLTKCLDITIGTPVQASLVFPVFIAGIHCVTKADKLMMRKRIDAFIESYGTTNVDRVKVLIERVWKENPTGSNVVDWYLILKELDWEVNFA